ncbi:hypothetical protein IH981_02470 [Patescibacteria group bacterium]|nr:hypothetical protein [Patescibacteria group bacterium]
MSEKEITERRNTPLTRIGVVGGNDLVIESFQTRRRVFGIPVEEISQSWSLSLDQILARPLGRS